jgi:hypothetical protein
VLPEKGYTDYIPGVKGVTADSLASLCDWLGLMPESHIEYYVLLRGVKLDNRDKASEGVLQPRVQIA